MSLKIDPHDGKIRHFIRGQASRGLTPPVCEVCSRSAGRAVVKLDDGTLYLIVLAQQLNTLCNISCNLLRRLAGSRIC